MSICVLCIDCKGLNLRGQQRPAVIMVIAFWKHVSKPLSICLSIYLLTYWHILTPLFSSMKSALVRTETGEECETRPSSKSCSSHNKWSMRELLNPTAPDTASDTWSPPSQLRTRSTDRKCASATSSRPTRSIKPRDTWCIQEQLSRNETHFTDSNLIFNSMYWITAPLYSAPNCGKRLVISCTVLMDHFALGDSWQAESAGVGRKAGGWCWFDSEGEF